MNDIIPNGADAQRAPLRSDSRDVEDGAGVRWTPLPLAEAPTEPTGENVPYGLFYVAITGTGGVPYDLKNGC